MIALNYRMGHSTVCEFLKPVCDAIWKALRPTSFPELTKEYWLYQAEGFADRWNFPHCLGAVDGKHVKVQAPFTSGSLYYNYKGWFSIILLGIVGFDYRFVYINVGSYGCQGDSQIFVDSRFGQLIESEELNIPPASLLPNDTNGKAFPYFFLADGAFALAINVMKGYAVGGLAEAERIFNY